MKKQWLIILMTAGMITMLNAECTNTPTGEKLAKSIESKNLYQSQKHLTAFKEEVTKYLDTCKKDEGKRQEIKLKQLTFEQEVEDLKLHLKKSIQPSYDCSKVPDDKALNRAFASANAENIKKAYQAYHKNAEGYLEQCASHEEYESVYEASMLHDEEYEEWEKTTK